LGAAIDLVTASSGDSPFDIPSGPTPTTSQSVTYSTRAIENVSDIMDALNISTSMSIKYGTIHGNGNASFVNENKVLDSDLNYVVTVIVNNDARSQVEDMEFQDIPGLPLDLFTQVYGDSFISGFTEGGEFNAVISIKLNDKSKHKAVKQSVDVQLAVGPPTLEVGAQRNLKEHRDLHICQLGRWRRDQEASSALDHQNCRRRRKCVSFHGCAVFCEDTGYTNKIHFASLIPDLEVEDDIRGAEQMDKYPSESTRWRE
jgi:hypothetical protein